MLEVPWQGDGYGALKSLLQGSPLGSEYQDCDIYVSPQPQSIMANLTTIWLTQQSREIRYDILHVLLR